MYVWIIYSLKTNMVFHFDSISKEDFYRINQKMTDSFQTVFFGKPEGSIYSETIKQSKNVKEIFSDVNFQ